MVSLRFRGFAVGNAVPLHKPELLQSDSMAVPFCTFLAGSACLAIKMHSFKDQNITIPCVYLKRNRTVSLPMIISPSHKM